MTAAKKELEAAYPATKVLTFAASVTDQKRVEEIVHGLGTIDILALDAGTVHALAPVLEIDSVQLNETFQVNVLGPFNLLEAFMALPPRSTEAERTVIYTSSAGIQYPIPGTSGYNASKTAMTFLMSAVAQEYGDKGLRAFAFHPAIAFTPLSKKTFDLTPDTFEFDDCEFFPHRVVRAQCD